MSIVSNGWLSKTISQERIIRVVKAAHESASSELPNNSLYMGPLDSFIDAMFCGGVKKTALNYLHDMSYKTSLLHLELSKPEQDKNPQLIALYEKNSHDNQQQLSILMSGATLEFGRESGRAIVGQQSYLIFREKSKLDPIGIPLFSSSAPALLQTPEPAIFIAPENIVRADLALIRTAAHLRCGNRLYLIRFTDHNEPIVVTTDITANAESLQKRLSGLWLNDQAHMQLTRLTEFQKEDNLLKLQPVFLGLGKEGVHSKEEREAKEKWLMLSKGLQDNFSNAIVYMHASLNHQQKCLVEQLEQVAQLTNPSVSDKLRLTELHSSADELINKLEIENKNISRLKCEYKSMCLLITYCKDTFMVDIFMVRIGNFTKMIIELGESRMGSNEIVKLNELLVAQTSFIKNFGPEQLARCSELMNPRLTGEGCNYKLLPPTAEQQKNQLLDTLKNPACSWTQVELDITTLAKEQEILLNNKIKQIKIGSNLDRYIHVLIYRGKMQLHMPGLNPHTGLSYYQPETYARIISLKKLRGELLNTDTNFSFEALESIKTIIKEHLDIIQTENIPLMKQEQRDYFSLHAAKFIPAKNPDASPMDHTQWIQKASLDQSQQKMCAIISGLREIHSVNLKNIAALQKRAPQIAAVQMKAIPLKAHSTQLHEKTKTLRVRLTKQNKQKKQNDNS